MQKLGFNIVSYRRPRWQAVKTRSANECTEVYQQQRERERERETNTSEERLSDADKGELAILPSSNKQSNLT